MRNTVFIGCGTDLNREMFISFYTKRYLVVKTCVRTYPITKSHNAAVLLMKQQNPISRTQLIFNHNYGLGIFRLLKQGITILYKKTNISIHKVHKVKFR